MSFLCQIAEAVKLFPKAKVTGDTKDRKTFRISLPKDCVPKTFETLLWEDELEPIIPFEVLLDWHANISVSISKGSNGDWEKVFPVLKIEISAKSMILDLDPPDFYHSTKKYRNLKRVKRILELELTRESMFEILFGVERLIRTEFKNILDLNLTEEDLKLRIANLGQGETLESFATVIRAPSSTKGHDHYIAAVKQEMKRLFE